MCESLCILVILLHGNFHSEVQPCAVSVVSSGMRNIIRSRAQLGSVSSRNFQEPFIHDWCQKISCSAFVLSEACAALIPNPFAGCDVEGKAHPCHRVVSKNVRERTVSLCQTCDCARSVEVPCLLPSTCLTVVAPVTL